MEKTYFMLYIQILNKHASCVFVLSGIEIGVDSDRTTNGPNSHNAEQDITNTTLNWKKALFSTSNQLILEVHFKHSLFWYGCSILKSSLNLVEIFLEIFPYLYALFTNLGGVLEVWRILGCSQSMKNSWKIWKT